MFVSQIFFKFYGLLVVLCKVRNQMRDKDGGIDCKLG